MRLASSNSQEQRSSFLHNAGAVTAIKTERPKRCSRTICSPLDIRLDTTKVVRQRLILIHRRAVDGNRGSQIAGSAFVPHPCVLVHRLLVLTGLVLGKDEPNSHPSAIVEICVLEKFEPHKVTGRVLGSPAA